MARDGISMRVCVWQPVHPSLYINVVDFNMAIKTLKVVRFLL